MTPDAHSQPLRSAASRGVVAAVVLIDLLAVTLASRSLRTDREVRYGQAAQAALNLVHVLAENLEGKVSQIDLGLAACAHELEERPLPGDAAKARAGRFMGEVAARVPFVDAIRATDADGIIFLGKGVDPTARVNIADRDYFLGARRGGDAMVVSSPLFGRVSGKWTINFARSFHAPDGSFRGVVYAPVTLEQFTRTLSGVKIGRDGVIVLRGRDNAVIARLPETPGLQGVIGQRTISPTLEAILSSAATEATFVARSPIDGQEKVNAFRRVGGTPFYLLVSASSEAFLAGWRAEVRRTAAVLALFVLLTAAATWLLLGAMRREAEARFRALVDEERDRLIARLQKALAEVKTLSGLLPICAHCKKIRDDRGYWNRIETYIRARSDAEFTHGICPDCAKLYFPDDAGAAAGGGTPEGSGEE